MTMTDAPTVPPHVPPSLVRRFDIDLQGPLEGLFPRFDALRAEGRVVWLETGIRRAGSSATRGAWLFTQEADIRTALQDPDRFGQSHRAEGQAIMLPLSLDPPEHGRYRRLLTPLFSPAAVGPMEDSIRQRIRRIVAELASRGSCDFVADVAIQFPTRVFVAWMGLPEEETGSFVKMASTYIHGASEERVVALGTAVRMLRAFVEDRLARPTDDLMSKIASARLDDQPLTLEELVDIALLLLFAGLDTVAAALSFSFWHLAQTPKDRRTIAEHEVPTAQVVEEMLRWHSFVNLARVVRRDGEFAGVQMKAGDLAIISLPMASRDPQEVDDPTNVHLERVNNRHHAFGAGPHRCLGSHLARIEMRVAFDEWHARIPEYQLDGQVMSYGGAVMGVTNLPLRWPPHPPTGD
jgi:cytochrome P450